jgi:hypothetical protein
MPRTAKQLLEASASLNAQYIARLNEAARDAVAATVSRERDAGQSLTGIANGSRLSIGCLRAILAGKTEDVTLGTAIALTHGLGLGSLEGLLGPVASASLVTAAEAQPSCIQLELFSATSRAS